MASTIFDGYPNPAVPGTVTPGTMPKRPDEYSFYREWDIRNLFDPEIHSPTDIWTKYIVPYEGEVVNDNVNRIQYYVSHVDPTTFKSTLIPFDYKNTEGESDDYPLYPKSEYGILQGEYPIMIDYSTVPPVARVTSLAYASNPTYAKLFYGNVIDENAGGKVISVVYKNDNVDTDRIDVVTVQPPGFNVEQDVIKCAGDFSVTLPKETLKNGTRCHLVYFDENGPLSPTYALYVQHSQYLRNHTVTKQYIKSIELLSSWFTNSTTPNTIYIPINLSLSDVVFRARINYSSGVSVVKTVNSMDGESGFTLHGVGDFEPTTPNFKSGLVLTYKLQAGEEAAVAASGEPSHLSESYDVIGTAVDAAYSPRLFVYPVWTANGYSLKVFMGDLSRKFMIDVTDFVRLNRASNAFSGNSYGVEQKLTFNLTLSDVSPSFNNWTFKQDVIVTLYNEGTSALRKYDVRYSDNGKSFQNLDLTYSLDGNGKYVGKFEGSFAKLDDFLTTAYYSVEPSINTYSEDKPLVPTHMKLIRQTTGESITLPVGSYNDINFGDLEVTNGESYFIAWIQRAENGDELQLACSSSVTRKV